MVKAKGKRTPAKGSEPLDPFAFDDSDNEDEPATITPLRPKVKPAKTSPIKTQPKEVMPPPPVPSRTAMGPPPPVAPARPKTAGSGPRVVALTEKKDNNKASRQSPKSLKRVVHSDEVPSTPLDIISDGTQFCPLVSTNCMVFLKPLPN